MASAVSAGSPGGPAIAVQKCMHALCGAEFPITSSLSSCPRCAQAGRGESLLDVDYDWESLRRARPRELAAVLGAPSEPASGDWSGVWRFRDLFPFNHSPADIVSVGEGRTVLQRADDLGVALGFRGRERSDATGFFLQYEGLNPSGSFKDNGMTTGLTHARMVGAGTVACASTGNTSASMALFAARAGVRAVVLVGEGKIALGKLSQALDYGARTLQLAGDFDACLARVRAIADDPASGVYLLNSVNPFRLEGQKSIMFRVLAELRGATGDQLPDWVVVPGGNLGNCSAFAKAFLELRALGLVDRVPRLAVINARGARTLDRIVNERGVRWVPAGGPSPGSGEAALSGDYDRAAVAAEFRRMDAAGERARTVATAIEINRPVNLAKALRAIWAMNGVVRSVDDDTILEHKALVGRHGFGCEPASAASVAGAAMLLREGVIRPNEAVVCIITGHALKDPDATVGYHSGRHALSNAPVRVADDPAAILHAMARGE